jgi:hypothetical protein
MSDQSNSPFIFYLLLEEKLPQVFYTFHKFLKERGYILVPVRIDQLQTLTASTAQTHIIVLSSVIDAQEYKLFNEKVRGLLKFVLKSKRLTFMQLSSFSKLNEIKKYIRNRNYFFLKYPLNARLLANNIAQYYNLKAEEKTRWPGGKRAGVNMMV